MSKQDAENLMGLQLLSEGFEFKREFRFAPPRRWRADFKVRDRLLLEVEGITRYGPHLGRHQTAKGYSGDCQKYNEALLVGYDVLRVTQDMVRDGQAMEFVRRYFLGRDNGRYGETQGSGHESQEREKISP